jgi:two-component system, OmpR family, phosphate regulon response regulator PhoB
VKPLVLIVEDEAALVTMLRYNLEKEGFAVCVAADGEEALIQIAERKPEVVLLDWMLPLVSGIEVCRQIRRAPASRTLPIIMLTARGEEGDRVRGLDAGADDYVAKPFSPTELVARIRAVLRRKHTGGEPLTYADLTLDPQTREVQREAGAIDLTAREYELLLMFMRHPRQVLTRDQLLERVWGYDAQADTNTLDVHIGHLRQKLEAGGGARLIQTLRGVGYALRE